MFLSVFPLPVPTRTPLEATSTIHGQHFQLPGVPAGTVSLRLYRPTTPPLPNPCTSLTVGRSEEGELERCIVLALLGVPMELARLGEHALDPRRRGRPAEELSCHATLPGSPGTSLVAGTR